MSNTTVEPTTLEVPASESWPSDADALARVCSAVTSLRVDVDELRALHASRPSCAGEARRPANRTLAYVLDRAERPEAVHCVTSRASARW